MENSIKRLRKNHPGFLQCRLIFTFLILLVAQVSAQQTAVCPASPPVYEFQIEYDWLTMRDGVRLSVTYFKPVAQTPGEKFPVLFELLPYRKDDLFYLRDYPLYSYFARRGFAIAKVDVRGTGSSEGRIPPREYSAEELDDAVEIIQQLAQAQWSNAKVAMWGISWGGFNAIQVAMRRPPALKAILAVHASDDLYHDDVHYIDGAFHVDEYELSIENDLSLPRSPDYLVDETYLRSRFQQYPWFFAYLKQQQNTPFWRKNSLRENYQAIEIPVFLIGGLLDGYRDTVPRMLENMKVPLKAHLGPWNHAWPDNGEPGPNYEWRHELTRWWDYWLKERDTGIMREPQFAIFVRDGHLPHPTLKETPGHWRYENWPITRTIWQKFYPAANHDLLPNPGQATVDRLKYVPSDGVPAGYWWGETTGDMRPADAGCLTYDSLVLDEKVEIIGFPRVKLRVAADARLAHWIVRLEDIHPNGVVSLVTGAVLNGAHRKSSLEPEYLTPGAIYDLTFPLHFTTWTFHPGHRLRLAISNALFPMIWPTPYPMTTQLHVGNEATALELPIIPAEKRPIPQFLPPEPREERSDAKDLEGGGWPFRHQLTRDLLTSATVIEWESEYPFMVRGNRYTTLEKTRYQTNDEDPAHSSFRGEASHQIELPHRVLQVKTLIEVRSDETMFEVTFKRQVLENGQVQQERQWVEAIPREFQ